MRKFTLSLLVLLVSVFFVGQSAFGQAMHTKTIGVAEATTPVAVVAKSADDFKFADMYSIDFEDEVEWTFDFMPWMATDVDLLPTYGITDIEFPHAYEPMAFIVFNPATTVPPMTDDEEIQPHTGDQFGACMNSVPDAGQGNDDWFISDMIAMGDGGSFNFWAKSYTDEYGLERFNVAVSTTTNDPGDFTVISGASYLEAPMAWTEYNYDLSAYAGMDIYVAIQCVSYDAFIFMIDDLMIDPGAAGGDCENFDSYSPGDYVAENVPGWTTWSNDPGSAEDALITDVESYSPLNSFVVEGATDLVQLFDPATITSGVYYYSNMMYIPTGFCGYFNLQKDVVPGVEYGFQIQFDVDGMASADAGAEAAAVFSFTFDEWHANELIVDLDSDLAEYYFDGVLIVSWPWSLGTFGTAGAITLGGVDYYAWSSAGNSPMCYFDDVCFMEYAPPAPCENFDALTAGGYVAEQLGDPWTTWSGTPGTAEDAFVTDVESNSPDNSFVVDAATIDLIYKFDDVPIETGKWLYSHYMYVPAGFSGYFNVQSDPTPGVDWNIELFFDDGGTGSFAGQSTETFVYDQDTWFQVEIMYDLDAGVGRIYFDGTLMVEFVNAMTIGAIDYFGSDSGGDPGAFYDDVCFEEYEIPPGDCENFDALTVGGYVADQLGGSWTTWSGTPGTAEDAFVSDVQSYSPDNSFVVDAGTIDLIYQLDADPIATGQWLYSNYIYVPTGFSGYFNVQSDPTPGVDWNLELYFDDGGTGSFGGQATETFVYPQDTWILVEINYDLDNGYAQVLFDGELMAQFVNAMTIGGIDFFGSDGGGTPGAYYDDVCFGAGWIVTGVEEPVASSSNTVVYPNPATERVTIESKNIIDEVRIYNNMGQLVYSGQFDNNQIMVNTSTFITGMYIVQISSDQAVEVRKLIIE